MSAVTPTPEDGNAESMDLGEPVQVEPGVPQVQVVEALVVNPGDHLLVSVRDAQGMTQADVERLRDLMMKRFPGVEVTMLAGASLAVHRPPLAVVPSPEPPHSRACGVRAHEHGPGCHSNCPTCGGRAVVSSSNTHGTVHRAPSSNIHGTVAEGLRRMEPMESSWGYAHGQCAMFDGETGCDRRRGHDPLVEPHRFHDPSGSGRWVEKDDYGREIGRGGGGW